MSKTKLESGHIYEVKVKRSNVDRPERQIIQVLSGRTQGTVNVLDCKRNITYFLVLSKVISSKELGIRYRQLVDYDVKDKAIKIRGNDYE